MNFWTVVSNCANVAGIVSFFVSIVTWNNTRKIRTSMLVHVETSEYKRAIDEQIQRLEACMSLLTSRGTPGVDANFFLNLMVQIRDISIAYETILPKKLAKKMDALHVHIKTKLYDSNSQDTYSKKDIEICTSMLVYIIAELRKEKNLK